MCGWGDLKAWLPLLTTIRTVVLNHVTQTPNSGDLCSSHAEGSRIH